VIRGEGLSSCPLLGAYVTVGDSPRGWDWCIKQSNVNMMSTEGRLLRVSILIVTTGGPCCYSVCHTNIPSHP